MKLKRIPLSADPDPMFLPRERPPVVREEGLRSLRLALNTPELLAGELPAGPARAAIALHDDGAGGLGLAVVVRSLADGAGVCWSWSGPLDDVSRPVAVDAALSFAESMGFLFDDEALDGASPEARRLALDGWWELAGWPSSGGAAAPPDTAEEAVDGTAGEAVAADGPRERLPLTKFRRRLAPAPEPAPSTARTSALGRLRLVKRFHQPETGERLPLWLRLLGSF